MRRPTMLLPFCLTLAMTGAVVAQPSVVAPPAEQAVPATPGTFALESPGGGSPREYQVDEVSIAVSRSLDQRGDAKADVAVSLGTLRPLDAFLLEWARLGGTGPAASRNAVITVTAPQASGPGTVTRYELDGAKVVSFSASHSAAANPPQVMIQVSVLRIKLNGVVLN